MASTQMKMPSHYSQTAPGKTSASQTSNVLFKLADAAFKEILPRLEEFTTHTGKALAVLADNPLLRPVSKVLGKDWILAVLGLVNLENARKATAEWQTRYPYESPSQISHRIIVDKAVKAGGVGLATNILPPIAAALFAIDLAALVRLQAEMVYEIAAAYGLDLEDPARRGEVIALFALSLGSGTLRTGLSFLEIIPGFGAILGASTNAIMLYTLGYLTCQFYEKKQAQTPAEPVRRPVAIDLS
ncbi:MAG: hypothetical protein D6728_14555 [Cyanobacteria bacterium J055]|nr:MAG: hypothetical protein D6728_14555 [Cyanobacteria bacterium J055]